MDRLGLDNGMEVGMVSEGRMAGGGIHEEGRTLQTSMILNCILVHKEALAGCKAVK